jgi:hypothetical protein
MEKQEFIIKLIVDSWNIQLGIINKLLNELSDEQLMKEVAQGKNRGIYLLGHLTAVHDRMLPLLDLGEQLCPELNPVFIRTPDKAVKEIPSVASLRANWNKVNELLNKHFSKMDAEQWLQKHTSVTEEDFINEPNRNKLNVLISRTNHLANHIGQLLLLKPV